MTVTMIIIIVAGVVIIAFGVLCLIAMIKAQKETRNVAEKILAVEKNLGDVSKAVSDSVRNSKKGDESIIRELNRQAAKQAEIQAEIEAEKKAKAKAEAEAAAKAAAEREKAEKEAAAAAAKEAAEKQRQAAPAPAEDIMQLESDIDTVQNIDLDEIDIHDLLDDFEDILPEIGETPKPVQHVPDNLLTAAVNMGTLSEAEIRKPEKPVPQIQHVDYDIGKSGKKYTASELEALIRE